MSNSVWWNFTGCFSSEELEIVTGGFLWKYKVLVCSCSFSSLFKPISSFEILVNRLKNGSTWIRTLCGRENSPKGLGSERFTGNTKIYFGFASTYFKNT